MQNNDRTRPGVEEDVLRQVGGRRKAILRIGGAEDTAVAVLVKLLEHPLIEPTGRRTKVADGAKGGQPSVREQQLLLKFIWSEADTRIILPVVIGDLMPLGNHPLE